MRQPTFSRGRRRTRQQRLLRTAIAAVLLVTVAALVVNLLAGGDEEEEPVRKIVFTGAVRSESEAAKRPSPAAAKEEAAAIHAMLNDWYQQAFVDPSQFGDGTFPEVAKLFSKQARAGFQKDRNTLTIGEARTDVRRVTPTEAVANVTVFFDRGGRARFAVADVRFAARATLEEEGARPLSIVQRATLHLEKQPGGWLVTYYDANQRQQSVEPSPTARAS